MADGEKRPAKNESAANRRFALGLVRAFGGAMLFGLPMLMTMEMWSVGSSMDALRLAIFILLNIPLLVVLSYYAGFEETHRRLADVLDAFTAYAVGFVTVAGLLLLFAILGPGMSVGEILGKIAVQAVPASIGAMLARSQFNELQESEEKRRSESYGGGLFLMAVGALYLSSSFASTEEMVLISYKMGVGHVVALLLFSLAVMHGLVYAEVAEGKSAEPSTILPFSTLFVRFTIVGYGIALLVSLYLLWTFGQTAGLAPAQIIRAMVVLGFPAALGAGAARLLI